MKFPVLTAACLPTLLLAACAQPPPPAPSAPTPAPPISGNAATDTLSFLLSHRWRLERAEDAQGREIAALFARPERPLQLDFAEGRLAVSNACNRMRASFRLDGTRLHLSTMVSTKMACADPAVMALDEAIGRRLQGEIVAERVHAGLDRLLLRNAAGDRLRFVGEAKTETRLGPVETVFLEIDARTVPCRADEANGMRCLHVRDLRYGEDGLRIDPPGRWRVFGDAIEGYRHEEGTRNVLRVQRRRIADPPANAFPFAYALDLVVESETVSAADAK